MTESQALPATELPTVLIADDEEDTRLLILEALGKGCPACEVRAYRDGEELWSHLQDGRRQGAKTPSLILLDLYMPRRNGHETLESIRSDPSLTAVPVVMLSSSEEPEDVAAAYRLGANHFAVKPSSFRDFRDLVRCLVRRWMT